MKHFFLTIILLSLIIACSSSKNKSSFSNSKKIYLNENGDTISPSVFQEKWRNFELNLARWDYTDATSNKEIGMLFKGQYMNLHIDYKKFKNIIERVTSQNYNDSCSFVITYSFLNDKCAGKVNNSITIDRKKLKFLPYKKTHDELLQNQNIVLLHFYENGFEIPPYLDSFNNTYFLDKDNILKRIFFKQSAFCGARIAIKPNGETLLNNGEAMVAHFIEYLEPNNWSVFFPN